VSSQLPLQIGLRPPATLEGFVAGDNAQALAAVRACALAQGEPLLFLTGPPGSGRSHLLAGACNLAAAAGRRCAYLPLGAPAGLAPGLLSELEGLDLVCLDDLDGIAGERHWEEAVFALFNGLRDHGGRLIVAAARGPGELPLFLPDLQSRLAWGLLFALRPLRDDQLCAALECAALARGLRLGDGVARYLVERLPRNLADLLGVLEQLDQASLAAKRPLTLPFVRAELSDRSRSQG
jgi:DnaA-homolog protein